MDGLTGRWLPGAVRGHRIDDAGGEAAGFPGLTLDPTGPEVAVQVFESADLPQHWARLDAFEGETYRRSVATVHTAEGELEVQIYELA